MTTYTITNQSVNTIQTKDAHTTTDLPPYTPTPTSSSNTASPAAAPAPVLAPTSASAPPASKSAGGFNRTFHSITSKAGWPLNKAANVIGAEGWWPTSMEKECNKAARILHSFTDIQDGQLFIALSTPAPTNKSGPLHPTGLTRKSLVKIPAPVLQNCAGLAIFNVIRAGAVHGSLAAGSGIVVARRSDGSFSPPSSFVVSTLGAGFVFGLDVYDCVCVLNTREQVDAFMAPRLSLGGGGSIAVGPVGTGGAVEAAVSKTARPMWSYMKSRGLWAGVQIDGTIIVTRGDANSVFYDENGISAERILRDDSLAWPAKGAALQEVLKAIDGVQGYDQSVVREVGLVASPGDALVEKGEDGNSHVQEQETGVEETLVSEKERLATEGLYRGV